MNYVRSIKKTELCFSFFCFPQYNIDRKIGEIYTYATTVSLACPYIDKFINNTI